MNAAEILKTYFGYDSFRNGQEEIVRAILAGEDALAIMPTGAGKSICYQVPALLLPGITIVVSPLISLMQDQVKALNEAGIHAAFINSSLTETQIAKAMRFAAEGRYKIIYVAPERLESAVFMQFAQNGKISMVTVDEAHCISQWGQDFRPSYLKIVSFIDSLADRPVVSAFTATATREVRTDIECTLKLHNPRVVVTGFDRENLYYSVEHITGKHKDAFTYKSTQTRAESYTAQRAKTWITCMRSCPGAASRRRVTMRDWTMTQGRKIRTILSMTGFRSSLRPMRSAWGLTSPMSGL